MSISTLGYIRFVRFWLSILALNGLVNRSEANSDAITIHLADCKRDIEVKLSGIWDDGLNLNNALKNHEGNSSRNATVDFQHLSPDSGAFFSIVELGTISAFQGKLSVSDFTSIENHYLSTISHPLSAEMKSNIEKYRKGDSMDWNLNGFDFLGKIEKRNNSFAIFGITQFKTSEGENLALTAQVSHFLTGCLVTVNYSLPFPKFKFANLFEEVWKVELFEK
jgi:hypothetical protein